MQLRSIDFGA